MLFSDSDNKFIQTSLSTIGFKYAINSIYLQFLKISSKIILLFSLTALLLIILFLYSSKNLGKLTMSWHKHRTSPCGSFDIVSSSRLKILLKPLIFQNTTQLCWLLFWIKSVLLLLSSLDVSLSIFSILLIFSLFLQVLYTYLLINSWVEIPWIIFIS